VSVIPGADHFFLRGMDRLAAVVAEWAGTLS
jgi:alpha/beta superfamily hydrolase